ncbi:ATP-dependent helicase [bacterium]|nr:ATP-dependent helicase [bacterium]
MSENKNKHKPNERQQECIDSINGKIMVLAGPGTGKTFTVTKRIASMLKKGIKPDTILCLTFSDAAASEMKSRLNKEVGIIASGVNIYTYHSFCNEIIKMYPDYFGISQNLSLINSTIERELMVEAIDEANIKAFVSERGGKYQHIGTFSKSISKLKGLRIKKQDYLENINTNPSLIPRINVLKTEIEEKQKKGDTRITTKLNEISKIEEKIEKAKELWTVFEIYTRKMLEHDLIDFADMINLVIDKFEEDSAFLDKISNKYKYFMVDEYQDTNDLQNKILFNLLDANEEKNVFVVGDDDQIIYGFQGANSENVDNFLKRYPETKVICLVENNRSTQSILDLSYRVVTQDTTRLENNPLFQSHNIEKKLKAKNPKIIEKERKIKRWQFGELIQEYNYIVEDIQNLINSSNCPIDEETNEKKLSEIAILSTKKSELKEFEQLLKSKNINCQLNEGIDIFKIRSVITLYFYMKALNNRINDSDKLFGLLLTEPFLIDLNDYNRLQKEFKKQNTDHNDFIANMKRPFGWINPEKISEFVSTFEYLQNYAATNNLRNTVIEIVNRTKILDFFYHCDVNKIENITGLQKIINEADDLMRLNPSANLNDFVSRIEYARTNNIEITTDKNNVVQNAVQLLTYHSSKGREFEHVYLPNLIENNWENFSMPGEYKLITEKVLENSEKELQNDSELLKKLFVGITRAKYALTLSHADNQDRKPRAVTKYLDSVSDFDFDKQIFEYKEDDYTTEIYKSLSTETINHRKVFENELKDRVKNITLSPTSINAYINCPRCFFYSSILKIDITDTDRDAMNFGSIIHDILYKSAKSAINNNGYISVDEAKELFNKTMSYTIFSTKDRKETYQNRGMSILDGYYKKFCEFPYVLIDNIEEEFNGINVQNEVINGKIDRIEKLSDGTYALYDYKTSAYTSAKQMGIGGRREDYYNQLCCYKYAWEKKHPNKVVSKAGIIYLNDNRTAEIELTSSDMKYIEELILKTYENIRNLNFNVKTDFDENACKFCAYKDLCKLDVI